MNYQIQNHENHNSYIYTSKTPEVTKLLAVLSRVDKGTSRSIMKLVDIDNNVEELENWAYKIETALTYVDSRMIGSWISRGNLKN